LGGRQDPNVAEAADAAEHAEQEEGGREAAGRAEGYYAEVLGGVAEEEPEENDG